MAKTQADLIRELTRVVDTLNVRVDTVREEVKRLDVSQTKLAESVSDCDKRVAVVQHQVDDLRRGADEGGRRRWGFLQGLLLAVAASLLTLLVQWLVSQFRRP